MGPHVTNDCSVALLSCVRTITQFGLFFESEISQNYTSIAKRFLLVKLGYSVDAPAELQRIQW